nr:RteC domain-containing protein [Parabacteroides distasonis]
MKKNIAELLCVIDTELFLQRRKYVHDWKQSRKPKRTIPFHWTGKMVDLVELLYALDTCDCINNGEIDMIQIYFTRN